MASSTNTNMPPDQPRQGFGQPQGRGLSDAPLSSGEREGLSSGGFVSPHAADDAVGEVSFVGSSGFASGLAFGGLAGEVSGRFGLAALLGDRGDTSSDNEVPSSGYPPDQRHFEAGITWSPTPLGGTERAPLNLCDAAEVRRLLVRPG